MDIGPHSLNSDPGSAAYNWYSSGAGPLASLCLISKMEMVIPSLWGSLGSKEARVSAKLTTRHVTPKHDLLETCFVFRLLARI